MSWTPVSVDRDPSSSSTSTSSRPSACSVDRGAEVVASAWPDGWVSLYRVHQGGALSRLASWRGHAKGVRAVEAVYGVGVYSISAGRLAVHAHGGAMLFKAGAPFQGTAAEEELTCFALSGVSHVYAGTNRGSLMAYNVLAPDKLPKRVIKLGSSPSGDVVAVTHVLVSDFRGTTVLGTSAGMILMWDPRSNTLMHEYKATTGGKVASMDVSGDLVASCGLSDSQRREPFVKVFDLRANRALVPVPCAKPPNTLKFLPAHRSLPSSTTLMTTTPSGIVRVFDVISHVDQQFAQVAFPPHAGIDSPVLEHLAVASTGEMALMTDSLGHLHVWARASPQHVPGTPVDFDVVDPLVLQSAPPLFEHPMSIPNAPTPLSHYSHWSHADEIVAGAYYLAAAPPTMPATGLLSGLPPLVTDRNMRPMKPLSIHPALLKRMQKKDGVGYIANTSHLPGNSLLFGKLHHAEAYVDLDPRVSSSSSTTMGAAQGEDDGATPTSSTPAAAGGGDVEEDATSAELEASLARLRLKRPDPPLMAGRSSTTTAATTSGGAGFAEVDFSSVNKTQFAGLEMGNMSDAWNNALLQLLYMLPPVRACALAHVSKTQNDLATEVGFLFRVLDQSRGVNRKSRVVQARNFLRAFRFSPDALALGLLEPSSVERSAGPFVRLVLAQMCGASSGVKDVLERSVGVKFLHRDVWDVPGVAPSTRETWSMVVDLVYPPQPTGPEPQQQQPVSFVSLLTSSFFHERKLRAWCEAIKSQAPLIRVKSLLDNPDMFILNVNGTGGGDDHLPKQWREEGFLPLEFELSTSPSAAAAMYEVVSVVSFIVSGSGGHLVSHCKLMDSYQQLEGPALTPDEELAYGAPVPVGSWLLFNDFCVSLVQDPSEVVNFSNPRRRPVVVVCRRRFPPPQQQEEQQEQQNDGPPLPSPVRMGQDVFLAPSIAHARSKNPLPVSQVVSGLGPGSLVAIDCEFVALSTDHSEFLPDGSRVVTEPSELALARVTCLSEDGTVFVDDYVASQEPVVDYLTRFSGVVPSDLDPATSQRHLMTFKAAYMKLMYLLERGCVFVGHGLDNDLRVLNLAVPSAQVRDTSLLFYDPSQRRRLSLKLLSAVLLGEDIQGRTHDSGEDARAALKCYAKYMDLVASGGLDEVIRKLYVERLAR